MKKFTKINFEDDDVRAQLKESEQEFLRLQKIQKESMKHIIGSIGKRAHHIQVSDYLKDLFNRLDFNSYYSFQ